MRSRRKSCVKYQFFLHLNLKPQVKRTGRRESKNQSTKYTIFGKIESPGSKKTSISQNSYPSKRLSRKERSNALRFPNTVLTQSEPLTDDKNLRKASSRSIKLSRKCNLSQMKESQAKHEDISALLPKIDTPSNSAMNKPIVSLPRQSLYNIVYTASTISTLSTSKIENKRTFANITNRAKSISNIASNHLHPSSSEYEINVLHYENDILSGNNFSQFVQSHLKSNWSSAHNRSSTKIQDDNNNFVNERNAIENHALDEGKKNGVGEKYSWEIDNWVSSSQRKKFYNARDIKIAERNGRSPYSCRIKYSWQVIGMGTQTSYTLLQDLLNNTEEKSAYKMCIKYSWQIIGISTQASLHDYNDSDYWSGVLLTPNKNYNEAEIGNNATDHAKLHDYMRYPEGKLKKYLILNNQQTQTFAEKEIQADPCDCYAKYSWQDLIKQYL